MRFREIPSLRFKKHTSRRKRRAVSGIFRSIWLKHGAQVKDVALKAQMDALIHGEGRVAVSWNPDTEDVEVRHVAYNDEAT